MRSRSTLALLALAGLAASAAAQVAPPRLLGVATPAVEAMPAPELTLLNTVSDDGRWLLFTSTSDRMVTNDLNAAADVLLLDRTAGKAVLISKALDGRSGNGASLAAGMSADGSRIVFVSRASNLVANDTNGTWDVFVYDQASGTTILASVASGGGVSTGPASELDASISAGGGHVIFRSLARDVAPNPMLAAHNLYRRDLEESRTECITTNLPTDYQAAWRLTGAAASVDRQAEVAIVSAVLGTAYTNLVVWKNLATGQFIDCATRLPPELISTQAVTHSAPAVSADGRFVAFRSEMRLAAGLRQTLCLFEVERSTAWLLDVRTNDTGRRMLPETTFSASLSADGRYVAYPAPWPAFDASIPPSATNTNGPSQVYLYDGQTQSSRLVSAAPDGVTPASADALDPRIGPDGRSVWFVSRATNLLAAATTESNRLYSWNRETGALRVVAELGDADPGGRYVASPNGGFLAVLTADAAGHPGVYYPETADGVAQFIKLTPAIEESSTAFGWIGVCPAGVSADGRYVAITAFPPGGAKDAHAMQGYLLDTHTGARQLVTRGVDGNLADAHTPSPSLSADGSKILLCSTAANLVSNDRNNLSDVFAHTVLSGERIMVRQAPLPVTAYATPDCLISPDGGVAFVTFIENVQPVRRLVSLRDGTFSAPFPPLPKPWSVPGQVVAVPSFSADGRRMAMSLGSPNPRVEIHGTDAWLAGGGLPAPALWVSPTRIAGTVQSMEPVLSSDGQRVAYFDFMAASGDRLVVATDCTRDGSLLFERSVGRQSSLASLSLSGNGKYVCWISRVFGSNAFSQVWRGDVDSGAVVVVSVAPDGVSESNADCKSAVISADGRYVAFNTIASNIVANDINSAGDVFLRDMQHGRTLLVSRSLAGAVGDGWSLQPFFSADGRSLFFLSHAPDLAGDDHNQGVDLFKVEILSTSGPLVVIQRSLTTNRAQLVWDGEPGKSYRIEFKDDLSAAAWSALPDTFQSNTPVDLGEIRGAHRFFRVMELP